MMASLAAAHVVVTFTVVVCRGRHAVEREKNGYAMQAWIKEAPPYRRSKGIAVAVDAVERESWNGSVIGASPFELR